MKLFRLDLVLVSAAFGATLVILPTGMPTVVFSMVMVMIVSLAVGLGIILQRAFQQGFYRLVGTACNTPIEANPRLIQGLSGTGTDAAAQEHVHLSIL